MNTRIALERISMIVFLGIATLLFVIGAILIGSGDTSAYAIGVFLVLVGLGALVVYYLVRWIIRRFFV